MSTRPIRAILAVLLLAAAFLVPSRPCFARNDDPALEKEQPVAIVAGVQGDVQIKIGQMDWRKCYALDLVRPTTEFQTGANGHLMVIFLYDDHRELLGPNSTAKADFRNLTKMTGTLTTEKSKSGGQDFDVPYITKVKLNKGLFEHADDPNQAQKEQDFLSAYVDVTQYPPIFHWRDLKTAPYRLQLFDEQMQFIYEKKELKDVVFRFPYAGGGGAPFRLTKTGQYYWQVVGGQENVCVAQYGFQLLTKPLVKFIALQEKDYNVLQNKRKGDTVSATELFLVYNQYHTLDKAIHLLQVWRDFEPTNPNVYRYLTRAYILKGCPLNARQALQQEIQLGGVDPVQP